MRSRFPEPGVLDVVNPAGGRIAFEISASAPGIGVSPRPSGVLLLRTSPSRWTRADSSQRDNIPNSWSSDRPTGVNAPEQVRVLVNNRDSDQRGTFVSVAGTLVDILADPARDRFYVLRQQKVQFGPGNDVLVYDGKGNNLIATMRTSATPTQMTMTMDRKYLLIPYTKILNSRSCTIWMR